MFRLDLEITDPEKLKPLYKPYPADLMEMYPVSPQVKALEMTLPIVLSQYQSSFTSPSM
jgi:hypothetical protein